MARSWSMEIRQAFFSSKKTCCWRQVLYPFTCPYVNHRFGEHALLISLPPAPVAQLWRLLWGHVVQWTGTGKVVSVLIHPLHKEQRRAGSLYLSERLGNDTVILGGGCVKIKQEKILPFQSSNSVFLDLLSKNTQPPLELLKVTPGKCHTAMQIRRS